MKSDQPALFACKEHSPRRSIMEKTGVKAALYWFAGVILAFPSVLLVVLYLVAKLYGIPPGALFSIAETGLLCTLIIAVLPALVVGLGSANGWMAEFCFKNGRWMLHYGNIFAWGIWMMIWGTVFFLFMVLGGSNIIDQDVD
ncbi:MAG TPA: hypothetical protein PLW99_00240 [Candidatus Paceibacterota bacterium]|nr:hypothetical protein [Candidatus Paceibacterota bacterium]